MVTIAALKSLIAWIWTWEINNFITARGVLTVYMIVATINVVIYMSFIIFYFRGKQIRLWIQRKNFFETLGLS
jgi:hypothetical protein